MSDSTNTHSIADYLAQLLKDRKQLSAFPGVFVHVERLLDEGRNREQTLGLCSNLQVVVCSINNVFA